MKRAVLPFELVTLSSVMVQVVAEGGESDSADHGSCVPTVFALPARVGGVYCSPPRRSQRKPMQQTLDFTFFGRGVRMAGLNTHPSFLNILDR